MPVLMVEVDRSTMAPERVAAKFTAYRELFRTKVKSTDPALAEQDPADRTVHWWRRTYPGPHTRPGYPPVALVVTGAGPVALANRQEAVADLSAECWRGTGWTVTQDDNDGDGLREYDDAVPVLATTLELLAEHGPLGPVWWRYGRPGRHSLLDALENPNNRAAYNQRQKAREKKAHQEHRVDAHPRLRRLRQRPEEGEHLALRPRRQPRGVDPPTRRPLLDLPPGTHRAPGAGGPGAAGGGPGGERRAAPVLDVPGLDRREGGLEAGANREGQPGSASARSANKTAPSRTWARWCCPPRPNASRWPRWSPPG
ncbi:hypothetical protein ACFQ0M_00010 [Kitasatospora aburaviensis]